MKKILSLLLVFALLLGLAVPAAAVQNQSLAARHFLTRPAEKFPADADVYVYPFASTLDATVIKGNTTVLEFQRYEETPRSDDVFYVEIYKGSAEDFMDTVYAGGMPELVETRSYPMTKFLAPNYSLGMSWTADSRYAVGDYTLAMLVVSAKDEVYDKDMLLMDIHVVDRSIPAVDLGAWEVLMHGYEEMPLELHTNEYVCLEPYVLPYNSTGNRNITVTSSKPEILEVRRFAGYVDLYTKGIGRVTLTFTCGNVTRSFDLLCGADSARNGKLTATNPNLCVGMTDKPVFEYSKVFFPVSLDWYSTNPAVATVKDGVVTAVGPGTAQIVVSGFGYDEYAVTYTVRAHELPEGTPISQRTATKPAMQVGHCSLCGQKDAVNIIGKAIFTDTNYKSWYSDHVDYVYDKGIMKGTGDTTFAPDRTMTRAELVTVLYRIAGSPDVSFDGAFADIPDGRWYTKAVTWAAQNKIVNGVGDGRFAPTADITREQIATILYRYTQSLGVEMSEGADLSAFPDSGNVGSYAKAAMAWAVAEELITGTVSGGVTSLSPKATATRAQLATIISRYQQMFPADSE